MQLVEAQMQADDGTAAVQLQKLLVDRRHPLSLKTILAARRQLGWTFCCSAYCQIICEQNKQRHLEWATEHLNEAINNEFEDVLWTDESGIMLECHHRFCSWKTGTQARGMSRN